MTLNAVAQIFLWDLFRLGLLESAPKQAIEWVASLYDRGIELPAKIESLMNDYWASEDEMILLALAIEVLENFCLDVEQRTHLTAYLFADSKIDITQAYAFLSFDGVNVDDSQPSVRKVADVFWLLRQDSDERVAVPPSDDSLLSEVLCNLAKEGKAVVK